MYTLVKELYLFAFAMLFRAGGADWSPRNNAARSVVVIALIQGFIILGIESWIEILSKTRLDLLYPDFGWVIWVVFACLLSCNYYILVIMGHGTAYERRYDNLDKNKKRRMQVCCIAGILISLLFSFGTMFLYRRIYGIG
jgi:hypothetical protein